MLNGSLPLQSKLRNPIRDSGARDPVKRCKHPLALKPKPYEGASPLSIKDARGETLMKNHLVSKKSLPIKRATSILSSWKRASADVLFWNATLLAVLESPCNGRATHSASVQSGLLASAQDGVARTVALMNTLALCNLVKPNSVT